MPLSSEFELILSPQAGGRCPGCGRCVPAGALPKRGICYECCRRRDGKSTVEGHHVFGRGNSTVVELPANLHRAITLQQAVRRPILRRYPQDDPLIESAVLFTVIAELAAAAADSAVCEQLPPGFPKLANVIAAECRRAADRQLSIQARLIEDAGIAWYSGKDLVR